MEEYTGEFTPFEEYKGEVLPLTDDDKSELVKKSARNDKLAEEMDSKARMKAAGDNNKNDKWLDSTPNATKDKRETRFGPDDPLNLGTGKAIAGGVWNAGVNTVQTAMAGADWLANHTTNPEGTTSNVAGWMEDNVPKYHPTTTGQAIVSGATELGTGMVAGSAATKIGPAIQGFPKVAATLGRLVGINTGGVAAMDSDQHPMFTGDNAEYYKLIGNLGVDPNTGTFDEQLLKNKLQVLGESFVLAKPAEWAARGAAGMGKFMYGQTIGKLADWQRLSAMEKQHAKDVLGQLADIGPQDNAQTLTEKSKLVADRIRKGADVSIPSGVESVPDVNYQRPAMEAYVKGGEGELGPVDMARAKSVQSAAKARKVPELDAATAQPNFELDRVTDQTRQAFGGKESSETARKAVLQSADNEAANYTNEIGRQETDLAKANKSTEDLVKDDPFLGQTSKDAENGIQLDLGKKTNQATDEIVQEHNAAKGKIIGQSNENYAKIDESTALADRKSFEKVRTEVEDYLPADIKKQLDNWGGDYGTLKRQIYPELSAHIDDLYKSGQGRIAKKIEKLRDNIKYDQVDALDPATRKTVEDADKYYKTELAPYKQGTSEKLTDIQRSAGFDKKTGEPLRPDELKVESRKALKSTFNDPDSIEHTRRVLSLVKDDAKKTNYILGNFAEDISDKIATKGISGIDPKEVADSIRPYVGMLEPKEAQRLEKFVNDFANKKQTVEQATKNLDALRQEAAEVKDTIYKGELGKFFDEDGLQNLDSDQVFSNYLKDVNGENRIKKLISRVREAKNPEAEKGLQSAYTKYFKDQVFDKGKGNAGEKLINTDTKEKLLEYGRLINEDNPTAQALFERLLQEGKDAREFSKAGQVPLRASDAFDKGARGGLDLMITMVFGQLNRWGARLRAVAGRAVSLRSTKDLNIQAHGAILSDPYKLADLIESEGKNMAKGLNSDFKKRLFTWGVMNGLYKPEQKNKLLGTDEQTEKAFQK